MFNIAENENEHTGNFVHINIKQKINEQQQQKKDPKKLT